MKQWKLFQWNRCCFLVETLVSVTVGVKDPSSVRLCRLTEIGFYFIYCHWFLGSYDCVGSLCCFQKLTTPPWCQICYVHPGTSAAARARIPCMAAGEQRGPRGNGPACEDAIGSSSCITAAARNRCMNRRRRRARQRREKKRGVHLTEIKLPASTLKAWGCEMAGFFFLLSSFYFDKEQWWHSLQQ